VRGKQRACGCLLRAYSEEQGVRLPKGKWRDQGSMRPCTVALTAAAVLQLQLSAVIASSMW
jgi:hypothetical protein